MYFYWNKTFWFCIILSTWGFPHTALEICFIFIQLQPFDKKLEEILSIIEIYSKNSVSFHEFIADINKDFTKEEKLLLISFLWEVAYADSKLDVDEERLIRRIADLIRIKDIEVLKLKDSAKN